MSSAESPGTRVTLDDLAAAAGVSKATASKALNNRRDISEATRRSVLEAASALGYRTRRTVAALPSPHITVVADDLSAFYTLDILKGAASAALDTGAHLTTTYTPSTPPRRGATPLSPEWFEHLRSLGYVGVITVTTSLDETQLRAVEASGLALVAIDPASPLPLPFTSIGATNWNGGVDATEHLIALGHRRIAFIRGPEHSVPSQERLQGYLSALQMSGIPHRDDLIVGGAFSYEEGLRAGRALLALPKEERPTAVFAGSDTTAIGVCEAARERGLRVPEDLSVVGFDDTTLARSTTPRLTSVHQPLQQMGRAAVRSVLDQYERRPSTTNGPVRLSTHLVVRDSTAAPASA